MIILSIDSGLEKTGFAFFDKDTKYEIGYKFISSGLIKTSKTHKTEFRLLQLFNSLKSLITKLKPETLIIEQLFFSKNIKTAIVVAQTQGVLLVLAAQLKMTVKFLAPLQIKQIITGYGKADKKAIQKMLCLLLKLDKPITQDDEADAVAVGLAYCSLNEKLT